MADIIWYNVLDSTNSEVRRHLAELDNLSVIAAARQTAGRGQGDHTWTSDEGANMTFTVVVKPSDLAARDALLITQCITHAICSYLLSRGVATRIKWPNDIYVQDRKICGILIENIVSSARVSASIVGIGLNVNQSHFPADLPNPVSLTQLSGQCYDVHEELRALHSYIAKSAALLESQEGRTVLDDYFFGNAFNIPEGLR